MEEVLRTSDGIALSTYRAALKAAGIESYVFDAHAPIIDGALGVHSCRVMVSKANAERARALVAEYHQALAGAFPDVDLSTGGESEDAHDGSGSLLQRKPETFWWQEDDDDLPVEGGDDGFSSYDEPEEQDFANDPPPRPEGMTPFQEIRAESRPFVPESFSPAPYSPEQARYAETYSEEAEAAAEQARTLPPPPPEPPSAPEEPLPADQPPEEELWDEESDAESVFDGIRSEGGDDAPQVYINPFYVPPSEQQPADAEDDTDGTEDDDEQPPAPASTLTTLLGGTVQLLQPIEGYRAAIDPVLLAAAVPDGPWKVGLDVGAGTGAAMLCVLARCQEKHLIGLEIQPEHATLARQSIALNEKDSFAYVVTGDLRWQSSLTSNAFDQVFSNPPFHGPGTRPPHDGRATAHMEDVPLQDWVKFCLRMLKPRGGLTMIHRADRLDELLSCLSSCKAGAIEVIPLWPKQGIPARRVIVRARKGMRTPLSLLPGLVLHNRDGSYTDATEAILRKGISLDQAMKGV